VGVAVPDNSIVESIRVKVREQIEKTEHLIQLIPPDRMKWNPQWSRDSTDVGHLLGHLLECLAGFCAVFHAAFPQKLEGMLALRSLPVNHFCKPDEAAGRIPAYAKYIEQGFELCGEEDLSRMLTTIFATESVMTLLLGNLEHLINHKYQLFVYLRVLGIPVTTGDIYCWRGDAGSAPGT
jgi:DinB superfamily